MTTKLRANEEKLAELHAKVADSISRGLDDPEKEVAYLGLALKFLKDNEIKADLQFNKSVAAIQDKVVDVKKLPFSTKPVE
jgi:hypothetical protein